MIDIGKLYESYTRFIRAIGGEPISFERWLSANPNLAQHKLSKAQADYEFDVSREREGDAQ